MTKMIQTVEQAELKACPFCGGAPTMRSWDWPYVRYQVVCTSCKSDQRRRANADEAAAAWNTRTLTAHIAAPDEAGIEARARELLVAQWGEHPQWEDVRYAIRSGACQISSDPLSLSCAFALKAIEAALASTPIPLVDPVREALGHTRHPIEALRSMVGDDMKREGSISSFMIRSGLLADLLDELATFRALGSPAVGDGGETR